MNRTAAAIAAIGLGLTSTTSAAYDAVAYVTFQWAESGSVPGWASSAVNSLSAMTNDTFFSTLGGNNSTTYYNADFATEDWFASLANPALPGSTAAVRSNCPGNIAVQRQYACSSGGAFGVTGELTRFPVAGVGPGAKAAGQLTVTSTTMTGTLTVISTNDEGRGLQFVDPDENDDPDTGRFNEATGYNVRSADGSPFKNVWYGVSSQMTLTVNLTGTFSETSWEITGGTVSFFDPAFQCGFADGTGTLCNPSTTAGGFRPNGEFLSWGLDQGAGAGTGVTAIPVFNAAGDTLLTTLSGVRASISIDANGNIVTNQGEFRTGAGSSGGGCPTSLRYGTGGVVLGTGVTCGTLQVGALNIYSGFGETIPEVPDPFDFVDVTNAALGTLFTSPAVTVTGLTRPAAISVSGGEYSIGCTALFTRAPGTVNDSDSVCVRQTSSSNVGTTTSTVLTIGGGTGTFSVTTIPGDTTPDPINFGAQIDVPLGTLVTSNTVTIAGINAPTPISIVGGEYSTNGGAYTSAAGAVVAGDEVTLRQTSSALAETTTNTFLTVGDQTATFSVTTGDTTPLPFAFTDVTGAPLGAITTSNVITVFGLTLPTPIAVTGGEYSINGGVFTTAPGTVTNGQQVVVRQVSSPNFSTTTNAVLNIGGVSDTFSVTTLPADTTPDPFTFADQANVALSTVVASAPVTIAGINSAAAISVTGGEYSIDSGAFTSAAGTVTNAQQVRVRVTSSSAPLTATNATLTVGGVSDTFTVTTGVPPDTTPNPFFFSDVENAEQGVVVESNVVSVDGMDQGTAISVSGPTGSNSQYRVNGGAWTNAIGTINPNDTLQVRHTTASVAGGSVTSIVTIGNPPPAPGTERYTATFTSVTASVVARDDQATTSIGVAVDVPVLVNDVGFDFGAAIVDVLTSPLQGTAVVVGTGAARKVRYTPRPGFRGADSFEYAIEDGVKLGRATVRVQVIDDADGDGVSSEADNCTAVANANQRDTDGDGFGNVCDADLNNDGRVNFADLSLFRTRFGTPDPDADFDGNGVVNFSDLARFRALFGAAPGPSGVVP